MMRWMTLAQGALKETTLSAVIECDLTNGERSNDRSVLTEKGHWQCFLTQTLAVWIYYFLTLLVMNVEDCT